MRAIWRQAKADLYSRRTQSALILLTLIAAATLITAGLAAANSVRALFERAFAAANGAHLWVYLQGDEATQAQAASRLAALPGVEASTGLRKVLYGTMFVGDEHEYISLTGLGPEPPTISRPIIVAGGYFAPGAGAVILLDHNLARARKLHVGDTIDFLTAAGRRPLTIVGLTFNVDSPPYPTARPAMNYVPETLLPELAGETKLWGRVGLQLRDPQAALAVWQAAQAEQAVRHARRDLHARLPSTPDRKHAVGILERGEALQPGQDAAIRRGQIARHNPIADPAIRDSQPIQGGRRLLRSAKGIMDQRGDRLLEHLPD